MSSNLLEVMMYLDSITKCTHETKSTEEVTAGKQRKQAPLLMPGCNRYPHEERSYGPPKY